MFRCCVRASEAEVVRRAAGDQTGLHCVLVSKVKEGARAWWEHGQEALGSRDSLGRGVGENWKQKLGPVGKGPNIRTRNLSFILFFRGKD